MSGLIAVRHLRAASWAATAAMAVACAAALASPPADRDRQRELNYEYAKLYRAVSGLRLLDELLLVKFESKETEQLIEQIAGFGSRMRAELEDLARAHPEVKLDEDGRTELSREATKRQQQDRMKSFAPLTGATGADFERMLLLGQSSTLYTLRFRLDAMADAETSAPRREYLRKARGEMDRLYVQTVKLLDKHYFRAPAHTPIGVVGRDD
jgi:hypothetical protein